LGKGRRELSAIMAEGAEKYKLEINLDTTKRKKDW